MLKAEIGDFLYIIIFIVLMLAGALEKIVKAKQQQNNPPPPQPYDDFEEVTGESASDSQQEPTPTTLEELMRRMMQTTEAPEHTNEVSYPEEAQSLEVIPELSSKYEYQPVVGSQIMSQLEAEIAPLAVEEKPEKFGDFEFEFDIRQAVIASEILNRKY